MQDLLGSPNALPPKRATSQFTGDDGKISEQVQLGIGIYVEWCACDYFNKYRLYEVMWICDGCWERSWRDCERILVRIMGIGAWDGDGESVDNGVQEEIEANEQRTEIMDDSESEQREKGTQEQASPEAKVRRGVRRYLNCF